MTIPALSFIIPVRNDAVRLKRCLDSIKTNSARETVEVIVVDNGSTDGTPDTARAGGATVVSVPDRVVAEVRNVGAGTARAELLAFVDADHELDPNWIRVALTVMKDRQISAAGADYLPQAGGTWVQAMYDGLRRHPGQVEDVDWLPSGNLLVRRDIFQTIGGFDTSLESCEDVDLCRRIRLANGRLVAVPDLRSTHLGDPKTLRSLFRSELWRGRDNLRVSLRESRSLGNLLGLGFTLLYLVGLAGLLGGLLASPFVGGGLSLASLALVVGLTLVRTLRLVRAGGAPVRALAFASTFDSARALALVVRVSHRTRRKE